MKDFKLNWVAILVAAIASFLFEALWYSIFLNEWLNGIGRTREWLMANGVPLALQYGVAILCAVVAATILSIIIQASGADTARRGIICGALVWLGFVATSWATEYIFEVRTLQIYAINAGFWLFDLMLVGAIVGAWKKKSVLASS
jgi:ABC-type thiamin/hydroxymethylpyrimidine transport system permease subunit